MSLLVMNTSLQGATGRRCVRLIQPLADLMRRARFEEIPIAHLHHGASGTALALKVPISRFDPVFSFADLRREFPEPLNEFLVHSPTKIIHVAGLVCRDQLRNLLSVLKQAGFEPKTHPSVLIAFEREQVS